MPQRITPPLYGLDNQLVNIFTTDTITTHAGEEYLTTRSIDIIRLNFYGGPCGIPSVWTKVYRTKLIKDNDIRFEEGRHYGEDWKFNLDILTSKDCRAVIVNAALYNYFDTAVSLSKKPVFSRQGQEFKAIKLMLDINQRYSLGLENKVHSGTIVVLISFARDLAREVTAKEMLSQLSTYIDNTYIREALSKLWHLELPLKFKSIASLLKIGPLGILMLRVICKLRK